MFPEDFCKDYKNILLVGTGGGNDIVSATFAALYLHEQGARTDIAGALSPAAHHTYDGKPEQPVNKIHGDIRREIPSKKPTPITFIDAQLPHIAQAHNIPIHNYYNFSLRYGTKPLIDALNTLIEERGYDLVLAVDVGGDILARGAQDSTLLSPAMDFTALHALSKIDSPSLLLQFGLGTDGELRPQGMDEILRELKDHGLLLSTNTITRQDPQVAVFHSIFEEIAKTRRGHTATMTLKTLEQPNRDVITEYRSRTRIGNQKWHHPFEVILPSRYAGKCYLIDLKGLARRRESTAIDYSHSLEQYLRLKRVPSWKNELDFYYLWSGEGWKSARKGTCLHLLVPSTQIPSHERAQIIQAGIHSLKEEYSDALLIARRDLPGIDTQGLRVSHTAKYCVVSPDQTDTKAILEAVRAHE